MENYTNIDSRYCEFYLLTTVDIVCYNDERWRRGLIIWEPPYKEEIGMAISKAQQMAVKKYNDANYDRIEVKVPKGKKIELVELAKSRGESLNALASRLLLAELEGSRAQREEDSE